MPLAIWQWQSSMSSKSCSNLCYIIDVPRSQMHKVLHLSLISSKGVQTDTMRLYGNSKENNFIHAFALTLSTYMKAKDKKQREMSLLPHTLGGICCVFPSLAKSKSRSHRHLAPVMHITSLTLLWSQHKFCWIAQSVRSFTSIHLPEVLWSVVATAGHFLNIIKQTPPNFNRCWMICLCVQLLSYLLSY